MSNYHNLMTECPDRQQITGAIAYAFFGFVLFPVFLSFCNFGFALTAEQSLCVDIIFHGVNFMAALVNYLGYLKESFGTMHLDFKSFFRTTIIGIGAILLVALIIFAISWHFGGILLLVGVLPLSELELIHLSSSIVVSYPILGMVYMVLLAPITISCLFYATIFATIANDRPWLAYLMTAVILAVPRIINALTFWYWLDELILYLIQLPIHMIACRLYHKTDTVWSPIIALAVVNLLGCGLMLFLFA